MLLFNSPWSRQPDAKLIAVLRDPVERTYSDFRFFFSCGTGPCVHRWSSFANRSRVNACQGLAFTRRFWLLVPCAPFPRARSRRQVPLRGMPEVVAAPAPRRSQVPESALPRRSPGKQARGSKLPHYMETEGRAVLGSGAVL